MKKSLIALAVLGAFATGAQAQTNVSIGGRIQASVKDYRISNSSRVTKNEVRVDDDDSSRFWITGTEDLGGGLKALFYVENRFNTDVNSSQGAYNGLGNGDTYLGLSGKWGRVTVGKHTWMETQGSAVTYGITGTQAIPSALGYETILNYVGGQAINIDRVQNSIMYVSPTISGFTGTLGYSTNANGNEGTISANPVGDAGDYSKGQAYFAAVNYTNGPIYLNAAYYNNSGENRPTQVIGNSSPIRNQSQYRLSGSYSFPFGLKAGFQWDRAKISSVAVANGVDFAGEQRRNAWQIPVSYQFGNSTILASYTKANDLTGSAGRNSSGAKLWTIGYDYALSKRTNVGAFFGKLDNDGAGNYSPYGSGTSQNGSLLTYGESASIFAVSMRHTF